MLATEHLELGTSKTEFTSAMIYCVHREVFFSVDVNFIYSYLHLICLKSPKVV